MSLENRIGDIFDQPDINLICHQANLYNTFGAGIAAIIKQKFPYAYAADCATPKGDNAKLGSFSVGKPDSKVATPAEPFVVNMYSQVGIGGQDRRTSYDAMVTGLETLERTLSGVAHKYVVGIPYSIGCGLANGNWDLVSAIIRSVFKDSPVRVIIVRLPSQTLLGEDALTTVDGAIPAIPDEVF